MALSIVELSKLAKNPIISGVAENIVTADQLSGVIPMIPVRGNALTFNREKALPVGSRPSSAASITASDALEFDEVTAYVRRFAVDQTADVLDARNVGMPQAKAIAVGKAAKQIGRYLGSDLISGNANWTVTVNSFGGTGYTAATIVAGPGQDPRRGPGILRYTHSGTTLQYKAPGDDEFGAAVTVASGVKCYSDNPNKWVTVTFTSGSASANGDIVFTLSVTSSTTAIDGLLRLVTADQTVSSAGTNGDAIALATLDQLADLVKAPGMKAYVMYSSTRRAIVALLRALGGVTMMEVTPEYLPSLTQSVRVPSYNGIPMLVSDWCPTNRSKGSLSTGRVVFCLAMGEEGVHGIYSEGVPGEEPAHQLVSSEGGITVLDLGNSDTADTQKIRVKGYYGLAVRSDLALAMADEITN